MDLRRSLRNLGLERYEAAFRENEIGETVLANLTLRSLESRHSDTASCLGGAAAEFG
jgi:hypothetical protein